MKRLVIILTPLVLSACITHANYDECTMPDEMAGIYINGDCMANDGTRTPKVIPEPEPEPEKKPDLPKDTVTKKDYSVEPDRETDPEGWQDWREHWGHVQDIEDNYRELGIENGPFEEDVTRALRSWMWSLEGEDI